MEGVQRWTKYKGEIKLECDGDRNLGAAIYRFENAVMRYLEEAEGNPTPGGRVEEISMAKFEGENAYFPRFRVEHFEVDAFLGSGSFGKVWKAKLKDSGQMVALKQYSSAEVPHEDIWKERDLLVTLKHPRICNIIGAFHDGDVFLVLKLCYGSLTGVINRLTERNKVRFAVQLGQGLEWIHSRNVIHADLNPDNCLVTTSNNLVITDFGSALILKPGFRAVKALRSLGSGGYQDFEANKHFLYSKESDMFSFAGVLFEIQTGAYLLHYGEQEVDNKEYARAFKDGRIRHLQTADITDDMERQLLEVRAEKAGRFADLLKKLIVDRTRRMTAAEFLASEGLRRLMTDERLSMDQIDDDLDWVTGEFSINRNIKFRLHQDKPSWKEVIMYDGIYYDEKDKRGEDHLFRGAKPRSLSRYCGPEIVEAVEELNLIPKLVGALAGLDAGNRTEVLDTIETWLERKYGPRSGQDYEVTYRTTTPATVSMTAPPSNGKSEESVPASASSSNKNSAVASTSGSLQSAPLTPSPSIGTNQQNNVTPTPPASLTPARGNTLNCKNTNFRHNRLLSWLSKNVHVTKPSSSGSGTGFAVTSHVTAPSPPMTTDGEASVAPTLSYANAAGSTSNSTFPVPPPVLPLPTRERRQVNLSVGAVISKPNLTISPPPSRSHMITTGYPRIKGFAKVKLVPLTDTLPTTSAATLATDRMKARGASGDRCQSGILKRRTDNNGNSQNTGNEKSKRRVRFDYCAKGSISKVETSSGDKRVLRKRPPKSPPATEPPKKMRKRRPQPPHQDSSSSDDDEEKIFECPHCKIFENENYHVVVDHMKQCPECPPEEDEEEEDDEEPFYTVYSCNHCSNFENEDRSVTKTHKKTCPKNPKNM